MPLKTRYMEVLITTREKEAFKVRLIFTDIQKKEKNPNHLKGYFIISRRKMAFVTTRHNVFW